MIECTILETLVRNVTYARKVLPFLKTEYFEERSQKLIFDAINNYYLEFNINPSKREVLIDVAKKDLTDQEFDNIKTVLNDMESQEEVNDKWLIPETEKFCKNRAIYNALVQSISIYDNRDDNKSHEGLGMIPSLLTDALGVSFDPNVGHDYVEDAEERFEFYHRKEEKIPFDLEKFNDITEGGLPNKTLNVILASCVHPNTKIRVRLRKKTV